MPSRLDALRAQMDANRDAAKWLVKSADLVALLAVVEAAQEAQKSLLPWCLKCSSPRTYKGHPLEGGLHGQSCTGTAFGVTRTRVAIAAQILDTALAALTTEEDR